MGWLWAIALAAIVLALPARAEATTWPPADYAGTAEQAEDSVVSVSLGEETRYYSSIRQAFSAINVASSAVDKDGNPQEPLRGPYAIALLTDLNVEFRIDLNDDKEEVNMGRPWEYGKPVEMTELGLFYADVTFDLGGHTLSTYSVRDVYAGMPSEEGPGPFVFMPGYSGTVAPEGAMPSITVQNGTIDSENVGYQQAIFSCANVNLTLSDLSLQCDEQVVDLNGPRALNEPVTTCTIDNCTLTATDRNQGGALCVANGTQCDVSDSTISSAYSGPSIMDAVFVTKSAYEDAMAVPSVTLNNCNLDSTGTALDAVAGDVKVSGGSIEGDEVAIQAVGTGNVTVDGTEVTSSTAGTTSSDEHASTVLLVPLHGFGMPPEMTTPEANTATITILSGTFTNTSGGDTVWASSGLSGHIQVSGGTFVPSPVQRTSVADGCYEVGIVGGGASTRAAAGDRSYYVGDASAIEGTLAAQAASGDSAILCVAPEGGSLTVPDGVSVQNQSSQGVAINGVMVASGYELSDGEATEIPMVKVQRLYNPYDELHLYTTDENEANTLMSQGWESEGVAWNAPTGGTGEVKVTRLYNPWSHDHYYSANPEEVQQLLSDGWTEDATYFDSAIPNANVVWCLFNPYEQVDTHIYTTDPAEVSDLVGRGYEQNEGVFYALTLPL